MYIRSGIWGWWVGTKTELEWRFEREYLYKFHISTYTRACTRARAHTHTHTYSQWSISGFNLKDKKYEFLINRIKYLGLVIDKNGRRPDPARSSAIKDLPAPENVSSRQSFLNLANYYNVFMPNMHCLPALLNKLLKRLLMGLDDGVPGSIRKN